MRSSAHAVTLCVLGREPLDTLSSWVSEAFSAIPNANAPPNRGWSEEPPFRPDDLGLQCFAVPIVPMNELVLEFPFLDEATLCKFQPGEYIRHLVGHKGPGSIFAYLQDKGWATHLNAAAFEICPGSPGRFECRIALTREVCSKPTRHPSLKLELTVSLIGCR